MSWKPAQGADFYIVRFGVKPDRLFENYQGCRATHLGLASLNIGVEYSVTVDAVNDSGIARGETVVSLPLQARTKSDKASSLNKAADNALLNKMDGAHARPADPEKPAAAPADK